MAQLPTAKGGQSISPHAAQARAIIACMGYGLAQIPTDIIRISRDMGLLPDNAGQWHQHQS